MRRSYAKVTCAALIGTALLSACAGGGGAGGFGQTLKAVRNRGRVVCGVHGTLRGFGEKTKKGVFKGFDVDYCKAIAVAVFGDDTKVTFKSLTAQNRFDALARGEVDVLIRNTTWTLSRDTRYPINFVQTTFYDGQGFLVRDASKIRELPTLAGKKICAVDGTTSSRALKDALDRMKIKYTMVACKSSGEMGRRYYAGECDAATSDKSALVGLLSKAPKPEDHLIIDPTISKEPLGPAVRHGDDQWFDLVRWVILATIAGEELGVASFNVDDLKTMSPSGKVRRFLGLEGDPGKGLGLSRDWAYKVVKKLGNYAEIYQRHFGNNTVTPIPRGLNRLYIEGGLLYAPPFR